MRNNCNSQFYLFTYTSIESLIPKKHMLRKVNKAIDLSFLKDITSQLYCSHNGRPSINLDIYFRMILIKYFYGISSYRKLCEEVKYNLSYRWFCGLNMEDRVPDHSSMSRIKGRLNEGVFKEFFKYVIKLCKSFGHLDGNSIIVDSTLVAANASLDSLKALDPEQAESEKSAIVDRSPLAPMPSRKISNKTHLSTTDPDASLARKNGSPQGLKYKVHNFIDAEKRVIVNSYVTTGKVHDGQVCLDRINQLIESDGLEIKEVIADRGYGSAEIIGSLKRANIKTYIPLFSRRSGSNVASSKELFSYNEEKDFFTCTEGVVLKPTGKLYNNMQSYYSKSSDCKSCPKLSKCQNGKKTKGLSKHIRRNINQNLFDGVIQDMTTDIFREKLSERQWKVEGIFGEAKENHCLRRANCRGLKNMQIQAYMIATVQNLKRLVK